MKQWDIYKVNLEGVGSEQSGFRPCVILQNDVGNKYSPTTIIAPITLKPKPNIPTHVLIDTDCVKGIILLEHIRTIDKTRLECRIGEINDNKKIKQIKKSIMISMGL